jgi:uncharacterized damage-inducible protein DinB
MQLTDLIRYNHDVRSLYFDALAKLPWAKVDESRGLSFDSMRNVFLHLTFVEDRWMSFIIPGYSKEWVDKDFDTYNDIGRLKKYMEQVKEKTESYLPQLSQEELNRQIVVPWSTTPDIKVTVETILNHIIIEDMIHYGELSAVLWQMGLEAPYLGFWRYKQLHP